MEFDLYEIKEWSEKLDISTFFLDKHLSLSLARNSHPTATNILYAHFNELSQEFSSWSHLTKETLYLNEKLKAKYCHNPRYNDPRASYYTYVHTEMEVDIKSLDLLKAMNNWKYGYAISYLCDGPLSGILDIPFEDLNWYHLSENQDHDVINFLKIHRDKIHWPGLTRNSCDAAVEFLLEEKRNGWVIDWGIASKNSNEKIVSCFPEVREELSVNYLSMNRGTVAIRFLLNDNVLYSKINWEQFCENPNDLVVDHILEIYSKNKRDKRLVWECLCANTNPRIFPILRENKEKIDLNVLLENPICFAYNYEKIRERFAPLKKEITDIFLHPDNIMAKINDERANDESDFEVISRLSI
jgi:hypothetical protein